MHDVSVALFWHQHQPYYPDDIANENPMPWVRLHGTKDYWGMAMHLREVPEVHATINLVPSLLLQLQAYTEHDREDAHLRVSRLASDSLAESDLHYLLDNFFMVPPDSMIRPHERYWELYQKRGVGLDTAAQAARRFGPRDILDLQCWSNLVWIHPLAFEVDSDLAEFRARGGNWNEDDKSWLLGKQMELLGQVIPLHRELAHRGQIELTTTPFYHPILPLLVDKRLARDAMPGVHLPRHLEGYPEDARRQIRQAVEFHERLFGQKPRGMWPSEGSVCQEVIADIADAGIEWIATDEEILSRSTNGWVSRDGDGHLRNPQMLYRPWRVEQDGRSLQMVFRDHAMSDSVGFHYQRWAPDAAAGDFISKLEAIGHATTANAGHRPTLATIILDGENCWEYYPNGGVDFLRTLYHRLASHPRIKPVRLCDYLERYPATDKLGHLAAGSWISHNFGIWIGHDECNRAWDLLHETREHLVDCSSRGQVPVARLEEAWREMAIAQGSDWFWWYGDDHSSSQDALFDDLFRKHLRNIYTLLGEDAPIELTRPISQHHRPRRSYNQPKGLLSVKIDGRQTYFEWINAGCFVPGQGRGTMSMASAGHIGALHFGFDTERLLLRLDAPGNGPLGNTIDSATALRVAFYEPEGFELRVPLPVSPDAPARLYRHEEPVPCDSLEVASEMILELSIGLEGLQVAAGEPLSFYVELMQQGKSLERVPQEGAIETIVPAPDYETVMWQV
jgi:alpha-amylase/alpha-mannosidase (GH57 family)